jgi:hypothetical protein
VAVTVYALAAAAMSASWLPIFPYLRDHQELLKSTATAEYFRAQRLRPVIGVALYGLAVPVVWFLGPAVGLSFFVIMIIFHASPARGFRRALSAAYFARVALTAGEPQHARGGPSAVLTIGRALERSPWRSLFGRQHRLRADTPAERSCPPMGVGTATALTATVATGES